MPGRRVDVFSYQDYRMFLRAYYEARKGERTGFSLRAFSKSIGLKSSNYFKLVMDGTRNLAPSMAVRFAQGCQLDGDEADYFCELVALNQARTGRQREVHYKRLARYPRYRKLHKLAIAQTAYHSKWFIPAVRELAGSKAFLDDPAWIAATLMPAITVADAEFALRVLFELQLLIRDDQTGRLVQRDELVGTGPGPLSQDVVRFHLSMMELAADALERVPRDEREFSGLTLCLSEQQLLDLKNELVRINAQLLQRFIRTEEASRVVQVNFQMFPLTRQIKGFNS